MANSFWLTKQALIEALKLSEGRPQNACVEFECKSEMVEDVEYTVITIKAFGKRKTVKQEFSKLYL